MLDETVFHGAGVPEGERLDRWREHLAGTYVPVEVASDHPPGFTAHQRVLTFGAVRVWTTEHPPMTLRRTPALIRRSDPGLLHVSLPLRGRMTVAGPGGTAVPGPYDVCVQDTSRPYVMRADADGGEGTVLGTGLLVERRLVAPPGRDRDAVRLLPGREGVGALLAVFLRQLVEDAGSYRDQDGPRLGAALLDLLSALLAPVRDGEPAPGEARRRALVRRVRAYVQQRLHDPELTPRSVAAAHHVSVSYLHRIFRDEDETVAAWIRGQRLERARRDLADPALAATPVHVIGARWGFSRASDFTRAFRGAYGVPPSDCRPGGRA
ncbi:MULTISPECIES: AraC family transcriptional regulator [Streptomyces]|uniref:AraC family transcriptional regulator n=1 Tax=Streptomyces sudanensis TaxID=436397 RepID=A0ABY4TGP8_9ACTN|nr:MULTISPECIES: AraC family transcriptional regulator [Streptomyces]URN17488.1 AraC family transcriptional regulator [Streptomyces sudanensis]